MMADTGGRTRATRRDVNGIVLLDKPAGLTSNQALQRVKRLFCARKAGHTGSLDPLATGVLPLCFGEATKVSAFLLDADKAYRVRCQLGVATATGDAEGEVIQSLPVPDCDAAEIQSVMDRFRGLQDQIPPMYSALKHHGRRLYELAREGKEVERRSRAITINRCQLGRIKHNVIEYEVSCSKGTYVRTLSEDIAKALGTVGHVTALRRYKVGVFDESSMFSLAELEKRAFGGIMALEQCLIAADVALAKWPLARLSEENAIALCHGQRVAVPDAPAEGWLRLYGPSQLFLGLGVVEPDGKVAPKRLMRQPI